MNDQLTAGIHLPQAGPAANPESIRRTAVLAEELGYADVWVSDHLAVKTAASYPPSPYIFEPFIALTWAAAATSRVGLGTSVLVLPMRNPLFVAKALASLDQLSGGRVILGTAAGWYEAEFKALGIPFEERGARTDEAIEILRRLWTDDHITDNYPVHGIKLDSMRTKPQPVGEIPIWIGGHAPVAIDRAIRVGDGWHGAFQPAEKVVESIRRMKAARPDTGFTISMRTGWDALEDDHDEIRRELDRYRDAGVTHLVPEPRQTSGAAFLESVEAMAGILRSAGVDMSA
ncbi:MAG: TIGR03619 family F420-dependent LLM class oxidoreductase [Proteobacteria bacterium]|nr:TIGR03619 family F420-dependent LLM class oxidoreductase [Pseudomonadota bacterium]